MRLAEKVMDAVIRVIAGLTAIGLLFVAIFVGFMALGADLVQGGLFLVGSCATIMWVLVSCFDPNTVSDWLGKRTVLFILLVSLPQYLFAAAGLGYLLYIWFAIHSGPAGTHRGM